MRGSEDEPEEIEGRFWDPDDQDRPALDQALVSALDEGRDADIEIELRPRPGGQPRCCTINLRTLTDESGGVTGALGCLADITDSTLMREALKKQASFDELTGCYNRASLMLALNAHVAQPDPDATRAAIFIDLDRFKSVNDTLGHAAGDELLKISAKRVRGAVRDEDMVGRIGGDEFLVMSPGSPSPEQAMMLARRLADVLCHDIRLAGSRLVCQASIGVAWSVGHGTDAEALVAEADGAMYESKRENAGQPKLAHVSSTQTPAPADPNKQSRGQPD
jgi:diguanylate cyclase (GGDEF)-like protein